MKSKIRIAIKRGLSLLLATVLTTINFLTYMPIPTYAKTIPEWDGQEHNSGMFDSTYMCIDSVHILGKNGGIYAVGDTYKACEPSDGLSSDQISTIWWAVISNYAAAGDAAAVKVIDAARTLISGVNNVSTEDVKGILHSSAVAGKYPWINEAKSKATEIFTAAGYMGGSGSSTVGGGGKSVPSAILPYSSSGNPLQLSGDDKSITLSSDFLSSVKVEYSSSAAGPFSTSPISGWSHSISGDTITFFNPDANPASVYVQFNVSGTAYASAGGSYSSPEALYNETMILWKCIACTQIHNAWPTPSPVSGHQRFIQIQLTPGAGGNYFALLGQKGEGGGSDAETSMNFQVYVHSEDWTSHYNLKLNKYDYETGKGLGDASFKIYERFDDKDSVEEDDGPEYITRTDTNSEPGTGGISTSPQVWDDFREIGSVQTDNDGLATFTKTHDYHYEKTFCDGHPAPTFCEVPEPEEEEDEETGETVVTNEDEIEEAKAANMAAAENWLATVEECEGYASEHEGVHFHWVMSAVDEGEISSIASSGGDEGSTPDAGTTESADDGESFSSSGCESDRDATYDNFINLHYSFAFSEIKARNGYTIHDRHTDDIPIEIITTNASEAGADSCFSGEYSSLEFNDGSFSSPEPPLLMPSPMLKMLLDTWDTVTTFAGDALTAIDKAVIQPVIELFISKDEEEAEPETEIIQEDIPSDEQTQDDLASPSNASFEDREKVSFFDHIKDSFILTAYAAENLNEPENQAETAAEEAPLESVESISDNSLEESLPEETEGISEEIEIKDPETEPETALETESIKAPEKIKETDIKIIKESEAVNIPEENEEITEEELIEEEPQGLFSFSFTDLFSAIPKMLLGSSGGGGTSAFHPGSGSGSGHGYDSPIVGGDELEQGPDGNFSHCNDADGEGNAWRVYDHRFEGQVHLNKRDLSLDEKANDASDPFKSAYGIGNGDATLEGAVYGLFAAEDITHPDGHTGTVYKANDLVSVATTDRDGNASFLVYTVAPAHKFDYATGKIVSTGGSNNPSNLYAGGGNYDDYTEDGKYTRYYPDYTKENGNCWIGRPLILGSYYIKELSRSEGYELSVGFKSDLYTNFGQDLTASVPTLGSGSVKVTSDMVIDGQLSRVMGGSTPDKEGDHPYGTAPIYGAADYDELFFTVSSKDTGSAGYDLVIKNLPAGSKLYRLDNGMVTKTVTKEDGTYTEVTKTPLTQVIAPDDYSYIKGDGAGHPLSIKKPTNQTVDGLSLKSAGGLDPDKVTSALLRPEGSLSDSALVAAALNEEYGTGGLLLSADEQYELLKVKTEYALRLNGRTTPKEAGSFSEMGSLAYSRGTRKTTSDPATFGWAIKTVTIDGSSDPTVGDMVTSVLDWYNSHPYFTCAGIESVTKSGGNYSVKLYASFSSVSTGCYADIDGMDVIFMPIKHESDNDADNRIVYALYTPDSKVSLSDGSAVFGYYTDTEYKSSKLSATLVNKAEAKEGGSDYSLTSFMMEENEYYAAGEAVYDYYGAPLYEKEFKPNTITTIETFEEYSWTNLSKVTNAANPSVIHIDGSYTDAYGKHHSDADSTLEQHFLIVVPTASKSGLIHTLTEEDIEKLPADSGWSLGAAMTIGGYYLNVNGASVKAYLDYEKQTLGGGDSYIKVISLENSDSSISMVDMGTVEEPIIVNERVIRQSVKVGKDIALDADKDGNAAPDAYRDNTYDVDEITKATNFRFKAYLKSNLIRLYRDENGNISWMDRNGNYMEPIYLDEAGNEVGNGSSTVRRAVKWKYTSGYSDIFDYPEVQYAQGGKNVLLNVPKLFTRVSHEISSRTTGNITNNVLNSYLDPSGAYMDVSVRLPYSTALKANKGEAVKVNSALYSYVGIGINTAASPLIRDESNKGFTRILETKEISIEDGSSYPAIVTDYDYEKFFDALDVANTDKWDDNAPTYTSNRPIGNKDNRSSYQILNAKRSDKVRQFAITYYLDDEVAKLTKAAAGSDNTEDEAIMAVFDNTYSEKLYDEALYKAILKAEDYLKPFFKYDLDCIYSLNWDSDANGGTDKDTTTLSVDKVNGAETYNTSAYLPYGEYVINECQPKYVGSDAAAFNDFLNKHYKKDRVKEVKVPSVYAAGKSNNTTDNYDSLYTFDSSKKAEEYQNGKYLIRFGEEWDQARDKKQVNVIRANSYFGYFEVYPYGLDIDHLGKASSDGASIVDAGGSTYAYEGYSVIQSEYDPIKDYYQNGHYGESVSGKRVRIATREGANAASWPMENRNSGKEPTHNKTARYNVKFLRDSNSYAAISEDSGIASYIVSKNGTATVDNASGMNIRTNVPTVSGELTAYNGEYAQMLVPYSLINSSSLITYDNAAFKGFADINERNTFYKARLRIEKLDSETHENILHDGASFSIYKAERSLTTGEVLFYDADTDITGSKEFIEGYCIRNTAMPLDPENPRGLYQGTVAAGTPVCHEADIITFGDRFGNQIFSFKAVSTTGDIKAKEEESNIVTDPAAYLYQNAGYLETPQPLGAGSYVIVETTVPSGYVRTKPIALEVYSDKVTYSSVRNSRTVAAIYEDGTNDEETANGNKPQDRVDTAKVFIEDAPIKLTVEKVKESSATSADTTSDKTVTYRVSGRVEGKLSDIGGRDNLEYVYINGKYAGYAYIKGTLEYLAALKETYYSDGDPDTQVEIAYDGTAFTGYAFVTLPLMTGDDANKYVTGAGLTMFDAIQLRRNTSYEFGKSDYSFSFPDGSKIHGLKIERDINSNVKRMYVEKGYAGIKVTFVPERDSSGTPITTGQLTGYTSDGKPIYTNGYIWNAVTLERNDTDILYYDLDSLEVTVDENVDGNLKHYGFNKDHEKVEVRLLEHDKANYDKSDRETSMYAFKGGLAVLEFVGGDFNKIKYDKVNKFLTVDSDTIVYHLDSEGNRDAMVDPYTGMAYLTEECDDGHGGTFTKYMVWPVEIRKDKYGNIIARDKITTSRVGTIGENNPEKCDAHTVIDVVNNSFSDIAASDRPSYEHNESGSVTGSWIGNSASDESHNETSDKTNLYGENLNGQVLLNDNNGSYVKEFSPIYDAHGNIIYYQRSADTYDKGTDLYDRNGDFVRYDSSDNLEEYNLNAYKINTHDELYDTTGNEENPETKKLYHRLGEGYVLENTWITSDLSPNDPFNNEKTDGQADILKRVPAGNYILEELLTPNGDENGAYVRAFPVAISVNETTEMHHAKMVDKTTKLEIAKIDGTDKYELKVLSMDEGKETIGTYTDEKTSYSYSLVGGATLALYKAKKVYSSDYIRYPKGYYLVKDETTPLKYHDTSWTVSNPVINEATWTTSKDKPIYLEGIPKGFYILEELSAPEGFVKCAPKEIEIDSSDEVRSILVNDEHTKVEVDKFYFNDSGEKMLLSGARLELHEAITDSLGNVILDGSGNPSYKPTAILSWSSADEKTWQGLAPAFKDMFDAHGMDGTSFSFTDGNGNAHTLTRTDAAPLDVSLAGGTAQKYPSDALLTFADEAGRAVRISVYEQNESYGKTTYKYEFEYDWIKLSSVNSYADSYMTLEGERRFNYLPVDKKYVVIETSVPEGYAKASPKVVTVTDTTDIQRYSIEDVESQMIISKVAKGSTKEYAGAVLSLYRAEGDILVKDASHLVETWKSGSDGTYSYLDQIYGRIPAGYEKGDLKAHTIKKVPLGTYYLVEDKAPYYYAAFEPIKITYSNLSEILFVRAENTPVKGKVTITKTDTDGDPLSGAVYLLKTYRADDLVTPISEVTYTSLSSVLTIDNLSVGEADENGNIIPYKFILKEIVAPKGYQVSATSHYFFFDPDKDGENYSVTDVALKEFTFKDDKTVFAFFKKDFKASADDTSDKAFIAGAEFKLFEMTGTDVNGDPIYDSALPLKSITTSVLDKAVMIEGLEAGKSYVFIETKAPSGYNSLYKPMAFTVSDTGRSISMLTNKLSAVTFDYIDSSYPMDTENKDIDSIASATLHGRFVTSIVNEVTDRYGNLKESWPGGTTHVIAKDSGYTDGAEYTITEKVTYSDGSTQVTAVETRNFNFDTDGHIYISSRGIDKVSISASYKDGALIDGIDETSITNFEKTILNGISGENPVITLKQAAGETGDALYTEKSISNEISYFNPLHSTEDITVTVKVNADTVITDSGTGSLSGDTLAFSIPGVSGFSSGKVSFQSKIKDGGSFTKLNVTLSAGGTDYISEKTVPAVKKQSLTIFNELTGSGKTAYAGEESTFTVTLIDNASGEELAGAYPYNGSKTGYIRSEESIALAGNEYVIISTGIYKNVHYKVNRLSDARTFIEKNTEGDITNSSGAFALFMRNVTDTSMRDIFTPGETIDVLETTSFTDGLTISTNRLQLNISEDGRVKDIIAFDLATKVAISKVSVTDGSEIVGCKMALYDDDGNQIDTWISGSTPHLFEGILTPGKTYRLVEESVEDAPGWSYTEDIYFTVDTEGFAVQKVKMADKPTKVSVSKTDISGTDELPGCKLKIVDTEGTVIDEWISTDTPHLITGVLEADKTYTLIEIRPTDGYGFAESDVTFTVSHDGSIDKVLMKDEETEVHISKTDITSSNELPGCKLQIIDKNGVVIEEWISTDTPYIIKGKLIADETYTLREIHPTDGWGYAEDATFTVDHTGGVVTKVKMEDDITKVHISKKDITGTEEVPGCTLEIRDKDGNLIESWVSDGTEHLIENKLIAGETYTLIEINPAPGFAYAEDITFTVPLAGGEIKKVVMKDDTTKVKISKTDITGSTEISGCQMEIRDSNGTVIDSWTSGETPHFIEKVLIAGETYTLSETKVAPGKGLIYADDITFTVPKDGRIDTVTMKDDVSDISVFKKSYEGTALKGAEFTLSTADNTGNYSIIDSWVSDGTAHKLKAALEVETPYIIEETKAPAGFIASGYRISFSLNKEGCITDARFIDTNGDTVLYYDSSVRPTGIIEKDIEGIARYFKADGSEVFLNGTNITDSTGKILFTGVGSNFADGTCSITVKNAKKPGTPSHDDSSPKATFKKIDKESGAGLKGAEITIYYSDKTTVLKTVTTDSAGFASATLPSNALYYYRETKAPDGYILSGELKELDLTHKNSVSVTIENSKNPLITIYKKDLKTKEPVPGVSFRILNAEGTVIFEGITDEEGKITFSAGPGTYKAYETEVPEEYILSTSFIEFTVHDDLTVTGNMTFFNIKKADKKGIITADYEKGGSFYGEGYFDSEGIWHKYPTLFKDKTGDDFPLYELLIALFVMIGALAFVLLRGRKEKKDNEE